MLEHGGRLRRAALRYGRPVSDWLDLSTGISPWSWLDEHRFEPSQEAWTRLPEPDDALAQAARAYYGVDALPVAGSQAAIQALPRLRGHSRVGVLAPSYAEHAACWRAAGHAVRPMTADACEMALDTLDVLVLVHPNNPDGTRFEKTQMLDWRARLSARGGWLVVDEAYIDAEPECSLAHEAAGPGLIVLRSLGKFFGLAGARVGFVLAQRSLLDALEALLGPWPLSGPSRELAGCVLRDRTWQTVQRGRLVLASRRLQGVLADAGLTPDGGCALFQWVRTPRAAALHESMAAEGILLRAFEDPTSLRFGLPRGESDWQRLHAALRETRRLAA